MKQLDEASATIRVDARLIHQALPFVATEDVRYYLNGICIRPAHGEGCCVMATDGYTAIALFDESSRAEHEVILQIPANLRGKLAKGGHLLHNAAGFTWLIDEMRQIVWVSPAPPIDYSTYPDIIDVAGPLSDYDGGLIGTYNPQLLEKIQKAHPKAKYKQVRFWTRRTGGGHGVALALLPSGFALIMPMRGGDDDGKPLALRVPQAIQPKQKAISSVPVEEDA